MTVLFNSLLVQNCMRSPILTRIGEDGSHSVPGGQMGTLDQDMLDVRISRPGCDRRRRRRVGESNGLVPLQQYISFMRRSWH